MTLSLFGLSVIFSIGLCVHAVRTGQNYFWLWIILLFQPLGGVVYLVAIVLPGIMGGPTVRKAGEAARETLDPTRDYRRAKADVDQTPTVHNRMRLAAAAGELGRWDEAEAQYRIAAQGVHADDTALMAGLAPALTELGRFEEALPVLEHLGKEGDPAQTHRSDCCSPASTRAWDACARPTTISAPPACRCRDLRASPDTPPSWPGAAAGAEAREMLAEIDRRLARTNRRFQREGRMWRDLAADAIGRTR